MPVRYLFINNNIDKQCIIPNPDPFDPSVMQYVWSPEPIHCDPAPDLAYVDENGLLQLNSSAFKYYGDTSFHCSYTKLQRTENNDDQVNFGEEVFFNPPMKIPCDFFRIRCYKDNGNKKVYENLLESVYVTEEMLGSIAEESSTKYSVFMFGIDSTSRLSAIRKLPRTYEYITKSLDAFVFEGYMKVGDNTFPNLVPVLTGKRPWTSDLPNPDKKKYDTSDLPFVWRNFSQKRYATFFAEDYPMLATFNTEAKGFPKPPTDHYMRPWMLGVRKIAFYTEMFRQLFLNWEYNNVKVKQTSSLCYGTKPLFKHLINYYKRYATMYRSKLKFGLSWLVQICHEYINLLELGDNDFYEFFKFLKEEGHLDNAFLIFFSDHGSRIDDIRNTFIGRIEERMPLLAIIPPKSFVMQFPDLAKNLFDNTGKLTSNFDLHETLNDILLENFDDSVQRFHKTNHRGTSLFRPISDARTCAEASIPEHFCACYASTQISTENPIVVDAAHFAVSHLNSLLSKYEDICAELRLSRIREAYEISLGLSAQGHEETRFTIYRLFSSPEQEKHKRFLVTFETQPGNAIFESTVDYYTNSGMKISDDVSRTNKYGNTSICVPEKPLRRYCFCKSLLKA